MWSCRPYRLVSAICGTSSSQFRPTYYTTPNLAFHTTIYTNTQSSMYSTFLIKTRTRTYRRTCSLANSVHTHDKENIVDRLLNMNHSLNKEKQKQETRIASKLELHARHLNTKAMLSSGDPKISNNLIAVKVSVDASLRSELKMNGREKRGRIFVVPQSEACTSVQGLKQELHAFFRSLKKSSFILRAGLPQLLEDGSIISPDDDGEKTEEYEDNEGRPNTYNHFWSIEKDQDVIDTFVKAHEFYTSYHNSTQHDQKDLDCPTPNYLKRPLILLRVEKDIHAPAPPPPPAYLQNMADPACTQTMTMLSFYAFPPQGINNPQDFTLFLKRVWKPFGALGRVYVAYEGINAQMSVPTNVIENFMECCRSIPELGSYMENGINIDPIPLSMDQFAVAGDMNGKPAPPFRALHVRVRNQVVADGLDSPLNWQWAGYDMPPLEWHEKLLQAQGGMKQTSPATLKSVGEQQTQPVPIILDCRNKYETNVGRFVGAEPLDTDNFRETWDALKKRLKDTPKDAPIMTYCTGGIRCVKVGAYLTQEMGFTNVSRLAGGIVSYDRAIHSQQENGVIESLFKGTNYVFDGRVGRQITQDALADCVTCGEKTSLISNCNNENCHKRITQCHVCRSSYMGTCSSACKIRVHNSGLRPVEVESTFFSTQQSSSKDSIRYQSLDEYSAAHSSYPPTIYNEILENTMAFFPSGAHMASGSQQGRLLTSLASMTREGRILELGTFTGYATACFLEGAGNVAEILNNPNRGDRQKGPFVLSLERDVRAYTLAVRHLQVMSKYDLGETGATEIARIRGTELEDIGMDSFTLNYKNAGCEVVRVNDALAYVEALSIEESTKMFSPFDLIFVDADKTRLLDYVDVFLKNDRILKKGGIIIVDNVLWKGGVLGEQGHSPMDIDEVSGAFSVKTDAEIKKSRRARKLANVMHQFNRYIVKDTRVEVVVLPLRDGLSIIRKKI